MSEVTIVGSNGVGNPEREFAEFHLRMFQELMLRHFPFPAEVAAYYATEVGIRTFDEAVEIQWDLSNQVAESWERPVSLDYLYDDLLSYYHDDFHGGEV